MQMHNVKAGDLPWQVSGQVRKPDRPQRPRPVGEVVGVEINHPDAIHLFFHSSGAQLRVFIQQVGAIHAYAVSSPDELSAVLMYDAHRPTTGSGGYETQRHLQDVHKFNKSLTKLEITFSVSNLSSAIDRDTLPIAIQ